VTAAPPIRHWSAGHTSKLERDRATLLDHDRRVVGLVSQLFRVTWQGTTRRMMIPLGGCPRATSLLKPLDG
jgi:hypothetical protein